MHTDIIPPKLVTVITDRTHGKKVITLLNGSGFHIHTAFLGHGTAPSDISAMFSLGERDKVILALPVAQDKICALFDTLKNELNIGRGAGIAFASPINSVSNMEVVKFLMGLNNKECLK